MSDSFLTFRLIKKSDSGKTYIWHVCNRNSVLLGSIAWYSKWRRYCFYSTGDEVLFDANCLKRIAQFAESETEKHMKSKQNLQIGDE